MPSVPARRRTDRARASRRRRSGRFRSVSAVRPWRLLPRVGAAAKPLPACGAYRSSAVTHHRVEVTPAGELVVREPAPLAERTSWALYDFANTIFSMNITTLFFPVWIVTERG